jgi:hypothetical protein
LVQLLTFPASAVVWLALDVDLAVRNQRSEPLHGDDFRGDGAAGRFPSVPAGLPAAAGQPAALQLVEGVAGARVAAARRAGEIAVRGKARRRDRFPLPAYLADGRPRSQFRQLILTLYAPSRPIHASSITGVRGSAR